MGKSTHTNTLMQAHFAGTTFILVRQKGYPLESITERVLNVFFTGRKGSFEESIMDSSVCVSFLLLFDVFLTRRKPSSIGLFCSGGQNGLFDGIKSRK